MKCVICHGDDVRMAKVKEEFSLGNDIVFVPVEVPVCSTCGERYYGRAIMRFLEDMGRNLREGRVGLQEVGKVLVCR